MRYRAIELLGLVALLSAMAWAQTSNVGSVSVTVLDQGGATVPNAQLILKDLETNDVRKAETQVNGAYTFVNLPFGRYELNVSREGFDTQVFPNVQVQTGRETFKIGRAHV